MVNSNASPAVSRGKRRSRIFEENGERPAGVLRDLDLDRLVRLRIAHFLLDTAQGVRGATPCAGAVEIRVHEPRLFAQIRLVARQVFDHLGDLASGQRHAPRQRGDHGRDDERDREPARNAPIGEPAHQRGEDEAQYSGEREGNQQVAPDIQRRNGQRRDGHAGGAVYDCRWRTAGPHGVYSERYDVDGAPTASAIAAVQPPNGFSTPESPAIQCSISEFSSPPSRTTIADIHIHIMVPMAAPSEP
jgi:hypothetical protein